MTCDYNIIKKLNSSSIQDNFYKELNYNYAYITVEDISDSGYLPEVLEDLIEGDYHSHLTSIENNDNYFVVKLEYDRWEEVKDLASTVSHLLLHYNVMNFTVSCVI